MASLMMHDDWQIAPGSNVALKCCQHSADLTCCNSYLLRFASCFVVIDPGGTERHLAEVCRAVDEGSGGRPVLVLLTHCHRDHARSLLWMKDRLEAPCFYVAQQSGAEALQQGDAEVTASFVYGENDLQVAMDGALLGLGTHASPPGLAFCREGPIEETVCGDAAVKSQVLTLDGGEAITVFHTPGHSDDSLCIQAGRWLFCGDILFAHRPVVAGLPGWSALNLRISLSFLDAWIASGGVDAVWSGHGNMLNAATTRGIIATILRETGQLGELTRLDAARIQFLRECAVVFMREVGVQLVAQGGRLLRIAEGLADLQEDGLAAGFRHDLDMDAVDHYIEEFHAFEQKQANDPMQAAIPMKGVELIRKIRKILKSMPLPDGMGEMYLFRLEFLLNDYIALMLGVDLRRCACATPLIPLVRKVTRLLKPPPLGHDELADLAGDEKAFGLYLARRLDEQARVGDVSVAASPEEEGLSVLVEPERLSVFLGDLLEVVLSGERREVVLSLCHEPGMRGLNVVTTPPMTLRSEKKLFYELFARLADGIFSVEQDGTLRLFFPSADADGA
ncbi:MAG: MBL fold metallo-hydrolase [Kiritimatiellae bacterium]|nr:MBL fold metallo-hydrolase [Kiritimatiellia bacterium]